MSIPTQGVIPPPPPNDRGRQFDPKRLLLDAAVAATLLAALGIVFLFAPDSGARVEPKTVVLETDPDSAATFVARPLRLGVTKPEYDDMGKLLDTLGEGYRHRTIALDDLLDAQRLAENDVVFLTCGGVPREWLGEQVGNSERGPAGVHLVNSVIERRLHDSLRTFVGSGGTLYVSDLFFAVLQIAFPEYIDHAAIDKGAVQTLQAEVVDPGLRKLLGDRVELRFDKPGWRPAAFAGPQVTTYLRAAYKAIDADNEQGPLLVKFPYKKGTVVFTSFHNEAQNTETELELLRYLVFTAVTAREEARIKETMISGGFSPTERSLLSASSGDEAMSDSYQLEADCQLEFALGFAGPAARLRLTVEGPGGSRFQKTGAGTFRLSVENAKAGRWTYTVTPLEVPYRNFPYTLTVGEKR